MTRSRHALPHTGASGFMLGIAVSVLVNLATENPGSWPRPLRIFAEYPWAFLLLVSIGFLSKAFFDKFRPPSAPVAVWAGGNPYPGLVAYDAERSAVFCGREPETRQVHDRILRGRSVTARFVPLIGPSGAGKSSLLQAGVIPALARQATVLAPFTPGNDPFEALARALLPTDDEAEELARELRTDLEQARPDAAACRVVDRLAAICGKARRVILPMDQLEELTTLSAAADRESFLILIKAVLTANENVVVIATLRSESMAFFQQDPSASLFDHPVMVNVIREQRLA